jgi:cytoskeletal protein RodZ
MKTVGEMLKEAREAKHVSLEDAEQATKIRKKFLLAIEADDYSILPSPTYAKGFVKNYGDYLGLNSDTVLAFYRRQTKEVTRSSLLPKGIAEPLNRSAFRLTPSRFVTLIVGALVLIFLLYFGIQYRRLQLPPTLVIESPKNGIIVSDKRVDIIGETDPDATVTVNGVGVIVHPDGKFFDQISLTPGLNTITVVATSRFGKNITLAKTIMFQE